MPSDLSPVLLAVIVVALVFDYTNGFHDAANAIATSIGTRALRPTTALAMAALLNVVGGLVYETKVASTMTQIASTHVRSQELVLAALVGAILWNLLTWYGGIPSSSSHALIGGVVGAALAASWGTDSVQWANVLQKVVIPTIVSPLLGLGLGALATSLLYHLVHGRGTVWGIAVTRLLAAALLAAFFGFIAHLLVGLPLHAFAGVKLPWWSWGLLGIVPAVWVIRGVEGRPPAEVNQRFRLLQTLSAGYMALEHGHNDAQKTMGIMTLALLAGGTITAADGVPLWVRLSCAVVIGLGTFSGGKRIIRTMGMKLVRLEPIDGFAAETVAASVLQLAGGLGMPVSTTHAITASITGVGATRRLLAVRWGITGQILTAWVLTLPAAAIVSALVFRILRAVAR